MLGKVFPHVRLAGGKIAWSQMAPGSLGHSTYQEMVPSIYSSSVKLGRCPGKRLEVSGTDWLMVVFKTLFNPVFPSPLLG